MSIAVNIGDLYDLLAKIKEKISELEEELARMEALLGKILNNWEGDAADAFRERMYREIQRLRHAIEALRHYQHALERAIREYEEAERRNRERAAQTI